MVFFVVFFIDVVLAAGFVLRGRAEALRYGIAFEPCAAELILKL
jgi:hypothetical protein